MGFFDDLAMGLGFKERTQDYDARTAKTIAAQDAYKSSGGSEAQKAHAAFQARKNFNYDTAGGNARIFLDRVGAKGGYDPGAYRPAVIQDDRPFTQRLFTSPQGPASPNPFAIGPASFSKPLPMPGLLGILGYASGLLGPKEPPTVSAQGGPMRVRPTGYTAPTGLTDDDMGLPGVPVPNVTVPTAPKYPSLADYMLRYGNGGLLVEPEPTAASIMESGAPLTSDMPVAESDPEYDAFVEAARQDPIYAGVVDNPEAMRNIYNMYKEQMGQ